MSVVSTFSLVDLGTLEPPALSSLDFTILPLDYFTDSCFNFSHSAEVVHQAQFVEP